jgi:hypothetical protein
MLTAAAVIGLRIQSHALTCRHNNQGSGAAAFTASTRPSASASPSEWRSTFHIISGTRMHTQWIAVRIAAQKWPPCRTQSHDQIISRKSDDQEWQFHSPGKKMLLSNLL